jgi:DEAD/DEAH box helicase domain-containing protein
MLPSVLTSQLQTGVEDFLRTTFPTTTPHFHGMLDRFFDRDGSVFKGPYVNVDLPFRHSGHGPDYFPDVPLGFPPYAHQAQTFERLSGPERQSTLMATGTGSGKTEAFLWPVLDYVRQHKDEERIKAHFIYPMNALANDQAGRIAEAVHEIDALEDVRVGLYVGDEEDNPTVQMGPEHVITSRQTLRYLVVDALRDYAEDVFGEPFEERAVIGEQRVAADDFLRPATHTKIPGPDRLGELRPDAYTSPEEYV